MLITFATPQLHVAVQLYNTATCWQQMQVTGRSSFVVFQSFEFSTAAMKVILFGAPHLPGRLGACSAAAVLTAAVLGSAG
jgi:hypothetical protein